VVIKITRPDGGVFKGDGTWGPGSDTVTTSGEGSIEYPYILNGMDGEFLLEAIGADGAVLATTTFTDSTVKVRAAGPAGVTFATTWAKYNSSNCTGSPFVQWDVVQRRGIGHRPVLGQLHVVAIA
jgi:hypothetical protein